MKKKHRFPMIWMLAIMVLVIMTGVGSIRLFGKIIEKNILSQNNPVTEITDIHGDYLEIVYPWEIPPQYLQRAADETIRQFQDLGGIKRSLRGWQWF